ncbi:hypothetical protein [Streptomyces sp. NPDC021224]|uniref:hypothetical protein n=1 Tax=unclassified Streptomyces TaxID=2593676 RepID=UPI003787595C
MREHRHPQPHHPYTEGSTGHPSHHTAQNGSSVGSPQISSFKVGRTAHLGQWVAGGTVPVTQGVITVVLHDRGIGCGSYDNAHHAAAEVEPSCTASS